jgi:hypothetical protein
MRLLYTFLFGVSCFLSFGQKPIAKANFQKIVKNHSYHCDSFLAKFDNYLFHDDLQMNILFLESEDKTDDLLIKGRVGDYTGEGMSCAIYLASISDTSCYMERKITNTDLNGNFTFHIKKELTKSLYLVSLGYHDVEIKISDLISISNK